MDDSFDIDEKAPVATDGTIDAATDGATDGVTDGAASDAADGATAGVTDGATDDAGRGSTGVDASPSALWPGDTGTLDRDARRALVQLLSGPSLDAERHGRLWPVLLREVGAIRSRLADLFLELVIDPDLGVAFVRQVEAEELDPPVLLRRQTLTFVDSVVLLHLRQTLIRAQSAGERAVVSPLEIAEAASVYARERSTDHAGFAKRVNASIEKIKKASLLRKLRGGEERYEVAPTLKLLFSAERVEALLREYRALAARDEAADGHGEEGVESAPRAESVPDTEDESP